MDGAWLPMFRPTGSFMRVSPDVSLPCPASACAFELEVRDGMLLNTSKCGLPASQSEAIATAFAYNRDSSPEAHVSDEKCDALACFHAHNSADRRAEKTLNRVVDADTFCLSESSAPIVLDRWCG
eukprot:Opistho-2@3593